jgi:LmbE family N-acetylglucosaminyl deacetylase
MSFRSLFGVLALLGATAAGQSTNFTAANAYESLLRLRTTATVLHTTAHPDDEDGGLLTWLARGQGVRTGLLTLTRGEGGADLAGPELFDALGIVRTEELLASDRYYGVDQFFTRAADFGFSKRVDETLNHWGKEEVLRDAVRVIRLYRPDVVISRFAGDAGDGHGNHQAAGLLTVEAVAAAADPKRFPEQFTEGLRPWQVKKLYRNSRDNEKPTLKIDTGAYDALLGRSYRQTAAEGLRLQRSQGAGGREIPPGQSFSGLQLLKSTLPAQSGAESSLFDVLDTSLRGLGALAPSLHLEIALGEIDRDISNAIQEYDARDPSRVVEPHIAPALRNLRAVLQNVTNAQIDEDAKYDLLFLLRNKEDEFMRAGNLLLGVSFEPVVAEPIGFHLAVPGQKFSVDATLTNRSNTRMEEIAVGLDVRGQLNVASTPIQSTALGYNESLKQTFEVTVAENAAYSRPYWSRTNPYSESLYKVEEPRYLNLPWAPPQIIATATYRVGGVRFNLSRPARTSAARSLVTIAPAINLIIDPHLGAVPVSRRAQTIDARATVTNNLPEGAEVRVRLELPPSWSATPSESLMRFTRDGEIQAADFKVTVPSVAAGESYNVRAVAESNGRDYRAGYEVIAHPGLEPRNLYSSAIETLRGTEVRITPSSKVGYIVGAGDQVPQALEEIGLKPQLLSPADLASANLSQFDTIFVGIRASAVRDDYKAHNSRLLDYVKNGGNLVVEYQTEEFDGFPYAPYPLRLGEASQEVCEENAKVSILDPTNPLFTSPNRITAADFDGWVEERGSKFASEWDAQFKPLLESHDQGQAPQRGGLLQARYGKGTFTYVAYALYRQLPAGVTGAYRLLANLASRRASETR